VESSFPKCQRCKTGDLVPLSDFGSQGAAIHYKAWACTNPECGYNLKIRNGDIYGTAHRQRHDAHPAYANPKQRLESSPLLRGGSAKDASDFEPPSNTLAQTRWAPEWLRRRRGRAGPDSRSRSLCFF
jgi:hypothetical protein